MDGYAQRWPGAPGTLDASDATSRPAWLSTMVSIVTLSNVRTQITYVLLDTETGEMSCPAIVLDDDDMVLDAERGENIWEP